MRRIRFVVVAVGVLGIAAMGAWIWRHPAYAQPAAAAGTTAAPSASVAREMTYVDRYWLHRNVAGYGDLGGTDCVNFASQALLARGWRMTAGWGTSETLGVRAYTHAWISSTAFMHYLAAHPSLATAVSDDHRSQVQVGDIAQFDWDSSGDRDHTAIVSKIVHRADGSIEIDVADHNRPDHLAESVDALLGQHRHAMVSYWHILPASTS